MASEAHSCEKESVCVYSQHGEIVDVTSEFITRYGYCKQELLGLAPSELLINKLRLTPEVIDVLHLKGTAVGYAFTSAGDAREVILLTAAHTDEVIRYTLNEKPNSRLSDKLCFMEQLFVDDFFCAALYSAPDLIILKANDTYKQFLKTCSPTDEAIIGRSVRHSDNSCPELLELLNQVLDIQKVLHCQEKKFIGQNHNDMFRNCTLLPIFSEGELKYILETSRDVTARVIERAAQQKQAEELRLDQHIIQLNNALLSRQAKLLDLSNDAIFVWEFNGPIVYWNKGAERMYGYKSSEAVGRMPKDLLQTELFSGKDFDFAELQNHKEWQGTFEHTTKAGHVLLVESSVQLIGDITNGDLVLEINRDVTEHAKMENDLRESELNFRMATEGAGAGVYTYDFTHEKAYWSSQYKAIMGVPQDTHFPSAKEFAAACVHPEDREKLLAAIEQTNHTSGSDAIDMKFRIIRPDKAMRWVHIRGQVFFTGTGDNVRPKLAAGSVIDITDETIMQDRVRRMSEELTHIIESTDDMICSIDMSYKVTFFNTAAKEHFKRNFGKRIRPHEQFTDLLPENIAKSFEDMLNRASVEGKIQFDLRAPTGRIISYAVNPVLIDNEIAEMTIFGKDITERLNAEREIIRLNSSLEERVAERTALLEQSVADLRNITLVLSHDMKSALRGIDMYSRDIIERRAVEENAYKIRKINSEIQAMVDGLMKYEKSSRSIMTLEDVNLKKIIVSVFNEINGNLPSQLGLLDFETGYPVVKVDKELLKHVIMNILSNAFKFTKPGEAPLIVSGCRAEDDTYVFYFKDNGIGFDMAYSDKIFGIFERLHSKNEYEGSGVGLAIVRNIIQRHGGSTWVESELGIGTTVYFTLPAQKEGAEYV